jgi:hypothetical protein
VIQGYIGRRNFTWIGVDNRAHTQYQSSRGRQKDKSSGLGLMEGEDRAVTAFDKVGWID